MIHSQNPERSRRKWLAACLAVVLLAATVFIPATSAKAAAATVEAPKVIRVITGQPSNFIVNVPTANRTLKNFRATMDGKTVKTLKCRVTHTYDARKKTSSNTDYTRTVTVYATKSGTYKLSFDVCIGDRKTNSRTVTVYASKGITTGISSVSFNGSKLKMNTSAYGWASYLPNATSGTLKIVPEAGIKITSMKMRYCNEKGKTIEKDIKNGSKVTLSNVGSKNGSGKSMWASSTISVEMKDSYTGETLFASFNLYRYAAKWCTPA